MSLTPLPAKEYQAFADFLQSQCGIMLGENKQYLVRSRLGPLVQQWQLESLTGLLRQAMSPGQRQLQEQVIQAMTTHETFWFRDGYPFDLMQKELLPAMAGQSRRLRLWSAACSTGQEAYSMAMVLTEFRQRFPGKLSQVPEILATDISKAVLAQAQRGHYDDLALSRGLSGERKRQFFQPEGKGYTVAPALRAMVNFRALNLLESYSLLGKFDLIFCRNVLIYFSQEDKEKILRQFAAALQPGGCLVLGASESIANLTDLFEMKRYPAGILYFRR